MKIPSSVPSADPPPSPQWGLILRKAGIVFCVWAAFSVIYWCVRAFRRPAVYSTLGNRRHPESGLPLNRIGGSQRASIPHTSHTPNGTVHISVGDGLTPISSTSRGSEQGADSNDPPSYAPDFRGQNFNQDRIDNSARSPASRRSPPPPYMVLPPQELA